VSFFEPLPEREPDPGPRTWAAPVWDRPSEGTLPAIVPVGQIVGRSETAVVAVESLGVYPNGFTISIVVLPDPHLDRGARHTTLVAGLDMPVHDRYPRVGVRFADGRTAGRDVLIVPPRDADGIPTEPIITMLGGGGGSRGYHFQVWVFPLPPDGPLDLYVVAPGDDGTEARLTLQGADVRAAAERAVVIWS
jgi:hypothetical protein